VESPESLLFVGLQVGDRDVVGFTEGECVGDPDVVTTDVVGFAEGECVGDDDVVGTSVGIVVGVGADVGGGEMVGAAVNAPHSIITVYTVPD
jgi:hypothetical protein